MKIGDQVTLNLDGKAKRLYRIVNITSGAILLEDMESWAIWSVSPKLLK